MTTRFAVLAGRIRDEVEQLDVAAAAAGRHWQRLLVVPQDQDVYLQAVALDLHGFYTGAERLLMLIARDVDGGVIGGEAWHSELLRQMVTRVAGVRPAVISSESAAWLDEYRKFRHLVRNVYSVVLRPDRMVALLDALPAGWDRLRGELLAFAELLLRL